jgi:putative ABC transport system substrate-binding protein
LDNIGVVLSSLGWDMRRRDFIKAVAGSAAAWPLAARAQQPATPVIGFLNGASPQAWASFLAAFLQGLKQVGYVDGQNIVIEYRWAQNQSDRLPGLAAELVRHPVSVMVTSGGDHVVQAAKAAAPTTPIVSTFGFDPVAHGLVASLNQPGGNITGVSVFSSVLIAKRVELLRELVPKVAIVAFLANPINPSAIADAKDIAAAAQTLSERVVVLNATTERECEVAFAELAQRGVGALAIQSDPFFNSVSEHLVALAKRYAVPVMYTRREFVAAGGLMSYGSSLTEAYRQLGIYTGHVLKGTKPADLPILLPSRFELVINLTTAKTLGIDVPLSLMVRADEMID